MSNSGKHLVENSQWIRTTFSTFVHSCMWMLFRYSHNAAISFGRSAPNRPKRLLLASRSNGEWLRMELKVNGYMARGKPVIWRTWCSLFVAMLKSAAGGSGDYCLLLSSSFVFVRGLRWVCNGPMPFSPPQQLASPPAGCRDGCWWGRKRQWDTKSQGRESGRDGCRSRVCGSGGRKKIGGS